jgi:hypothetical protein
VEHDCGDSYDFSPSKQTPGKINKIIESKYQLTSYDEYHRIDLQNVYEIPNEHGGEKVKQVVNIIFHITNNDTIAINIKLNNKVKDAR